jgi:hypothetical protein
VKKVYASYIEKYISEFKRSELTSYELGIRKLYEFLIENDSEKNFNQNQRIILAAFDYDEQTLSAVTWLIKNNVDISCFKLKPFKVDDEAYIDTKRLCL